MFLRWSNPASFRHQTEGGGSGIGHRSIVPLQTIDRHGFTSSGYPDL
jgi:hypothetical protein